MNRYQIVFGLVMGVLLAILIASFVRLATPDPVVIETPKVDCGCQGAQNPSPDGSRHNNSTGA